MRGKLVAVSAVSVVKGMCLGEYASVKERSCIERQESYGCER
jgi:hypothetical protein